MAVHEIHEPRMDVRRMVHALRALIERETPAVGVGPLCMVFGDAPASGKMGGQRGVVLGCSFEALRRRRCHFD